MMILLSHLIDRIIMRPHKKAHKHKAIHWKFYKFLKSTDRLINLSALFLFHNSPKICSAAFSWWTKKSAQPN
jgi:hypothetical protein